MVTQIRGCFLLLITASVILVILTCFFFINGNTLLKNLPIRKLKYVKTIMDNSTYMLSSIANLDLENKTYPNVYLFGWKKFTPTLYCCYLYGDGKKVSDASQALYEITKLSKEYRYSGVRYSCPIYNQHDLPLGVTLRLEGQRCPVAEDFLNVYYPTVHTGQLALCLQIVYGKLNVRTLVAWFEMQRLLGVNLVVAMIKDDLSDDIKKVLRHYHDQGFANIHPFELIEEPIQPFDHIFPFFMTEGMIVLAHCFAAMRGYSYAGVLDSDEFIFPSTKQTLTHLIENNLTQTKPNAAGFVFQQEFFEKDERDNGTFYSQLLFRLAPTKQRNKCIFVNNRTTAITTAHTFTHLKAFKMLFVDPEVAAFHHYRFCPRYLSCDIQKYYDDDFIKYTKDLEPAMKSTLLKLGSKHNTNKL